MKKHGYVFEVGELVHAEQGTRIHFDLNETDIFEVEGGIEIMPPVKAKLIFMTVEDGIHVNVEDFAVSVKTDCSRCLKRINYKIAIKQAERVYFFKKQKGADVDDHDTFYVDMKNICIDLKEFLRQEIILHFSMFPVCLKSCKGLCALCGKDLNKEDCRCKKEQASHKPLSVLRDLSKNL